MLTLNLSRNMGITSSSRSSLTLLTIKISELTSMNNYRWRYTKMGKHAYLAIISLETQLDVVAYCDPLIRLSLKVDLPVIS